MNKEISFNGHRICYHVYGKGEPVMLVHGFGETSVVWHKQVEFLQHAYFLIVPDLPGSGDSELTDDMSIEGMADVLKAIYIQELSDFDADDTRLTVVGHSMGGHITLAFVEKYHYHLRRFGLFHSSAAADHEERKKARRKGIAFMQKHGPFEFLKAMVPNLYSRQFREEHPEFVDKRTRALRNISLAPLVSYYEAMINRPDRTILLKQTDLPVLFIMSENDTAVAIEDSLTQCHMPGKSYIYILPNSGHMGMLEEPKRSNKILEDFLQSD